MTTTDIPEPDDTTFIIMGYGDNARVYQRDDTGDDMDDGTRWFSVDLEVICLRWSEIVSEARRLNWGLTILEPTEKIL